MAKLTNDEYIRYGRHLVLKEFGEQGQLKLKQARVLVVGAGGLGSPVLLYLTAAGVGTIGVADHDIVDISNLQRQILFTTEDIGKNKAQAAAARLQPLNPHVHINPYTIKITSHTVSNILKDYDVVVDGTDNFPTRYLLNDACVLLNKPWVYGSILEFEGQVSVFNLQLPSGFSPTYRDLFPVPPNAGSVPNCSEAGVLGVLPGIIGSMQASEVIKIITGIGKSLAGRLLILDALTWEITSIGIPNRNAHEAVRGLIDYENFCGISPDKSKSLEPEKNKPMKEITVQELEELKESGADFQLIDVREPHEFDICDLGGELIPMGEIVNNINKISKDKQVVIHCRSGKRSSDVISYLEKNHGFQNLYNLKGGILAWAREIDPSMSTY